MIVNLLLRRADEVGRDYRDAIHSFALGHLRQTHDLARRLRARSRINGNTLVYMSNGRGDDFLLFALIERVKLAVGAEYENAVDAVGDEVVDEPAQARQIEILVGLHRRGNGRNDAGNLHDDPHKKLATDEHR